MRHRKGSKDSSLELLAQGYQSPIHTPFFLDLPEEGPSLNDRRSSLEPDLDLSSEQSDSSPLSEESRSLLERDSGRSSYGSQDDLSHGITLTWRNLSVFVPQDAGSKEEGAPFKQILNNVSGVAKGGCLLAVLGSSGAGKSTLLGALSRRLPKDLKVEGDILVNGKKIDEKMKSHFGYVDQHDLFFDSLTVQEHLLFMARMKMDRKETLPSLTRKVKEVINALGLNAVHNTRIGSTGGALCISGGERKRLSFASEILTDPHLLFCDEPTTGLDSYNAKKLVTILRGMAARGKTIICTIHQPSSEIFGLFHRLLLLAEGRIAFLGKLRDAETFLESLDHKCPPSFNPADYYIHTLSVHPGHEAQSKDRINRICNAFEVSEFSQEVFSAIQVQINMELAYSDSKINAVIPLQEKEIERAGFGVQLYWLMWRCTIDSYRNPMVHRLKIVQRIVIALLIGICYVGVLKLNQTGIQNIEGVITLCVGENVFPCLFGVLNTFGAEIPIFLREYKNGVYGCAPYYLSKAITMIPGMSLWGVAFIFCSYWLIGFQNSFYPFIVTLIAYVIVCNVSSACGIMMSALFEKMDTMLLVLIPLNQVMFATNGINLKMDTLPSWLEWTKYVTFFFFTTEIVSTVQWEVVTNITCDQPPGVTCVDTGAKVLEQYDIDSSGLGFKFTVLISIFFLFHLVGYFGIRRRAKKA